MLTKEEYAANRKKWIEALRSGEYEQGKDELRCMDSFCCIGVGADLFGHDWLSQVRYGYEINMENTGLRDKEGVFFGGSLVVMNDNGKTFSEIADIIESNPDGLWAEGTY